MEQNNLKKLVFSAILIALVFVVTYIVRIPVLASGAYINPGDSMVYLSAFVPGGIYGALAAGLGSALADLLAGAAVYALPTFVIKLAMSLLCFIILKKSDNPVRFLLASVAGGAVMVVGYWLTELLLFDWAYSLATLPGNLIQWAGGVVIAFLLFLIVRRLPKKLISFEK